MSADVIDSYEDMFKEITRKLYGGSSNDSQQSPTQILVQQPENSMADFETSNTDRIIVENANLLDTWISSEETLTWTQSSIASFNAAQNLFRCNECECVGFLSRIAEHWLGTHANLRVFECSKCSYSSAWARCVRMHLARQHELTTKDTLSSAWCKASPVLDEVTRYLERLKAKVEAEPPAQTIKLIQQEEPTTIIIQAPATVVTTVNQAVQTKTPRNLQGAITTGTQQEVTTAVISNSGITTQQNTGTKRYNCSYCGYATDRRDLFTRHENIHRDDKPFHCYVCLKQFNRADHVKKHFVRMHRESDYDITRIKKDRDTTKYLNVPTATNVQQTQITLQQQQDVTTQTKTIKTQISGTVFETGNMSTQTTQTGKTVNSGNKQRRSGERRYSCCYCSWSGLDNWCLKRHLNTHIKPYVCSLCDYKAARAERLATHVFKVHNKRTCPKCSFLADDQAQLNSHTSQQHQIKIPQKIWCITRNYLREENLCDSYLENNTEYKICSIYSYKLLDDYIKLFKYIFNF